LNALARAKAKAIAEAERVAARAAARAKAKADAEAAASRFRAAVAAVVPAAVPGAALILPGAAVPSAAYNAADVDAYVGRLNIGEINRLIDNSDDFGFDVLATYYHENPVNGLPPPDSDMLAMIYAKLGRNADPAVPPH
jgi:hypothetical protein